MTNFFHSVSIYAQLFENIKMNQFLILESSVHAALVFTASSLVEIFQLRGPKSLYISHLVSNFYGTEIEIWAGFGLVSITEKKNWPIISNF